MAVSYEKLKSMTTEELIEGYNGEARYVSGSLDYYIEELRHREVCTLLRTLHQDLAGIAAELQAIGRKPERATH